MALEQLEKLLFRFGPGLAKKKRALLDRLAEEVLPWSDDVVRLHDALCFLRAYPDDRALLDRVESLLAAFEEREDLDFHREELANSGIAGTEIHFSFYWFTLRELIRRWPDLVTIDWSAFPARNRALLDRRLSMLMPYAETLALEEFEQTTRRWIESLKGADESDATFVVRRFEAMQAEPMSRESIFEEMDIPFVFRPGADTPNMTHAYHAPRRVHFQRRPLQRSRDSFRSELESAPLADRRAGRHEARELIDLARTLMIARIRDLDCFVHASEDDVRILDYPESFQFVCYGSSPERRQLVDSAYGFLMLRNGVIVGYVLSAALFSSAEVAFNVSPAFRGAEAAHLYGRSLSMVRHLFGADAFVVDPYQMGHGNPEGLRSGAWWFYYKLGFRPRDPQIAGQAETELEKVRTKPGYRTSIAKLDHLASVNMYLHLGEPRDDVIGEFSREALGMRIVRYMAERFGADREHGLDACSAEAARLLRAGSVGRMTDAEQLAWRRWAPLVLLLPGVRRWSVEEKRAAAKVIRAKGGRRESEFVRLFDRHAKLRAAVTELASD